LVLVLPPLAPPPPPPVLPYTTLFRSRSRRSSAPRRSPRRACHRSTSTGSSPRHVPLGLQPPSPAPWHVAPVSVGEEPQRVHLQRDRKSTRLNSSHVSISYAVFCLKKK